MTQALSTIQPQAMQIYALLSLLGCTLVAAIWHDVRTYRVPNGLIVAGLSAALLLHGLLDGTPDFEGLGIWGSLEGFATGFVLFLPFYLLRAAGAGDVKLMATVGAFIGPLDMFATYIWTCVAGAVFALLLAARKQFLVRMLQNLAWLLRSTFLPTPALQASPRESVAKLPYSVAIAAGTAVWMAMRLSH